MLPVFFGQNDIIHTVDGMPSGRHKAEIVVEDYQGKYNFATPTFPALDAVYLAGVGYKFNLRNLFEKYAGFNLPVPSINQILPEAVKGNIIKAKVRVRNISTLVQYENISEVFAIINGGMSEYDFAKMGNAFFETYSQVKGQFLTWQPKLKTIETQSPEHLYWLQNIDSSEITITVRYTVNYPTLSGVTFVNTTVTFDKTLLVKPYEMACIPVRPDIVRNFNSSIDPAMIKKITVQVLYAATSYVSEIREFRMLNTNIVYPYKVFVTLQTDTPIFLKILNSFGVWDTLRLHGKIKQSTETERSMMSYQRKTNLIDLEGYDKLFANTGTLDQGWLRYMKQLLYARKIYHITPSGNREIVLESKSFDSYDATATHESFELEFRYTEQNNNYSNL